MLRGTPQAAAVKAPRYGDSRRAILEDIGVVTGGRVISKEVGVKLENVGIADLGSAKKTTLVEVWRSCAPPRPCRR